MTRAEQLRVSAVFACLLAGGLHVGSRPATVEAQGTLPTRLIQAGDFTYVGRFELPDARDGAGNDGFDYSNGVLAFNAYSFYRPRKDESLSRARLLRALNLGPPV